MEEVITASYFGTDFEKACKAVEKNRHYRSQTIEFYEDFDLSELVRISKRELKKDRCIIRVDKYVIVSAESLTAWETYKREKKKRRERQSENKRLVNDPIDFVIEELSVNETVTRIRIRETLDKYACYSPENLYKVLQVLEKDGINIST